MSGTASVQFCALLFTKLNVIHDFVKLVLIDLRTLVDVLYERVTDDSLGGSLRRLLNKLVVDLFVDENSAASDAALPLVQEETQLGPENGSVHVCIVHYDISGLATEFERDALQVMYVRVTHDFVADFS